MMCTSFCLTLLQDMERSKIQRKFKVSSMTFLQRCMIYLIGKKLKSDTGRLRKHIPMKMAMSIPKAMKKLMSIRSS